MAFWTAELITFPTEVLILKDQCGLNSGTRLTTSTERKINRSGSTVIELLHDLLFISNHDLQWLIHAITSSRFHLLSISLVDGRLMWVNFQRSVQTDDSSICQLISQRVDLTQAQNSHLNDYGIMNIFWIWLALCQAPYFRASEEVFPRCSKWPMRPQRHFSPILKLKWNSSRQSDISIKYKHSIGRKSNVLN